MTKLRFTSLTGLPEDALIPSQVNEAHLTNFLSRHLPTCRCPFGGVRQDKTVRAALRHFDAVLSSAGPRISNQEKKPDALSFEIQRFDDYLRTASGLQEATCEDGTYASSSKSSSLKSPWICRGWHPRM